MTIFLSWSGDESRIFAESFKPWLETVIPGSEVWLSTEDIDKGSIWFTDIVDKLNGCNCGVICLTRENYLAPWIHFEAGGMVKGLGKGRVATIVLNIEPEELRPPLNMFNATRLNRLGAWYLVKSLAKVSDVANKNPQVLERLFEKFWPDLEREYQTQFPAFYRSVRDLKDPAYMPEDPAAGERLLFGDAEPRRKRKSNDPPEGQAKLFNGSPDEEMH